MNDTTTATTTTPQQPLQICISDAEMAELCRCYRCNCKTYPICTWLGEPCNDCFDVELLQHYHPTLDRPGEHQRVLETNNEQRPLVRTFIEQIKTQPNGDCLYEAIAHALNHYVRSGVSITIEDLRAAASRFQSNDTFTAYQVLAADQPEYRCISQARTLRGFKNIMQRCGEEVGPEHCLWGDENTLNIFSQLFKVRFAVFNDKGQLVQRVQAQRNIKHTILLRLNSSRPGEEHFSLLRFNGETILQAHEWNWLQNRLKLTGD